MSINQLSLFNKNDHERSLFEPSQQDIKPANFSITKTINASAQVVFDQWLIPVFIGEWMFGSQIQNESVVSLENKVRKGGKFRFVINRKGREVQINGEITELDIPKDLAFIWVESTNPGVASQISANFFPLAGKTKLKLSVKLPVELGVQKDHIKKLWTARLATLAAKFK